MKVGDLVKYRPDGPTLSRHVGNTALIIAIVDGPPIVCRLMMDNGNVVEPVPTNQLEVVSECNSKNN